MVVAIVEREEDRMPDGHFVGPWRLVGTAQAEGQASLIGDDSDPAEIDAWLNGDGADLIARLGPASGLALVLLDDGTFSERVTGAPALAWFDREGVLSDDVTPFDGMMIEAGQRAYLRPGEMPSWARPVEGRHGPAVLRYDDGDTKIADGLAIVGAQLLRTVNVVTDELYFTRVVMVYARAAA
jgi:hypothetical protein